MVKIPPPDSSTESDIDARIFHDGIRRRAKAAGPFLGVSVPAHRAAEALMETFSDAGMPRSADFLECLGFIVDGYARIPEMFSALLLAHDLCLNLLALERPRSGERIVPPPGVNVERGHARIRAAVEHVALQIEEAVGLLIDDKAHLKEVLGEVVSKNVNEHGNGKTN